MDTTAGFLQRHRILSMNKHRTHTQTAFNYWLAGEEHPNVMISASSSIVEAEQTLRQRFEDRVVKVERFSAASEGGGSDAGDSV